MSAPPSTLGYVLSNQRAFFDCLRGLPVHESEAGAWGFFLRNRLGSPLFNAGFGHPDAATLARLARQARERSFPLGWWLGEDTDVTTAAALRTAGLAPVMRFVGIHRGSPVTTGVGSLRVERVRSVAQAEAWTQLCASGFGLGDSCRETFLEIAKLSIGHAQLETYLTGEEDAAACLMAFRHDDTVGMYAGATSATSRRRGLMRELVASLHRHHPRSRLVGYCDPSILPFWNHLGMETAGELRYWTVVP